MASSRGYADLRGHGVADKHSRRGLDGVALFGWPWISAGRNDVHVLADERLPFGAVAEADLQPTDRANVPIRPAHSERAAAVISAPAESPDSLCLHGSTIAHGEKNDDPLNRNTRTMAGSAP